MMPGDTYPKFKAAAVQAAPVFLNRDATIEKIEEIVKEAKAKGADLIVFPESFIPTFPLWCIFTAPIDSHDFYKRYFENAVMVPSPQSNKLAEIARAHEIFLSVGIAEKSDYSMGAIWCTQLLYDRRGKLINRHRKLVPTWAEMMVWNPGDASDLRPVETEIGKIGTAICGENTNILARYALLAQGEQVHIASYPPTWPFLRPTKPGKGSGYSDIIHHRAWAHAFEGKVFVIASSAYLDEEAIEQLSGGNEENYFLLQNSDRAASLIVGPNGSLLCEPLIDKEGIVYADIDISEEIINKEAQDIVGRYNRFDIFQLSVNQTRIRPIRTYSLDGYGKHAVSPGAEVEEMVLEEKEQ